MSDLLLSAADLAKNDNDRLNVIETKDSMDSFIDISNSKPDISEYKNVPDELIKKEDIINTQQDDQNEEYINPVEEPDDTEGTGIEDPFLRSKLTWGED